ncbi:hypothetical protein scyTo_0012978 [Scyliorhinus torazame]|uniref:Uncharacterized protein n=1 Tax=Scyliorhinus torazame TaxID=75743 RepID=A0A401NLS1_SCYTO|nr:hypothetical protein [Scyliorhinus torazame]
MLLEAAYGKVPSDAVVSILGFTKGSVIILHEAATTRPLTNKEINSQIQNLSPKYTAELLPENEIPCHDETGTRNFDTTEKIPCEKGGGSMTITCKKNGIYEKDLRFCISEKINDILQVVNSTSNLENNFSNLLEQLSNATDDVTTPGDILAVVDILTQISNVNTIVNETDMKVFHYIFTILNAFQGFFILVFGTFMDKKIREALLKTFSFTGFSSRTKTAQNTSTTKPVSKPNQRLFSRKDGYKLTP